MADMTILDEAELIIKHRDIFKKQISSLKKNEKEHSITVLLKKNNEPRLIFAKKELTTHACQEFFCENTKDNVQILIDNWDFFVTSHSKITFITLSTTTQAPWSIKADIHAKMLGEADHSKGIWSLYENN